MAPPSDQEIDQARQLADVDASAIHHRVRYAELLRLAGREDAAADAYRTAARACAGQGDWYRAFALARAVVFLDPGDTEIQRYITSAYARRAESGATTSTTDTGEFSLVSGVREGPVPAALAARPRMPLETSRLAELAGKQVLSDLDVAHLQDISHLLRTVVVTRGETIFREGETSRGMFLILRGGAEVKVVDDAGQQRVLNRLGEGDFFGEFSLLGVPVRSALVEASSRLELLDVDVLLFELLTEASARFSDAIRNAWRRREAENIVSRISLFADLDDAQRERLIHGAEREELMLREVLVRQGDVPRWIHLLSRGSLELYDRDDLGEKVSVTHLRAGRLLPDPAVVRGQPYRFHARALEPCVVFRIHLDLLLEVAGETEDGQLSLRRAFTLPELASDDEDTAVSPWIED